MADILLTNGPDTYTAVDVGARIHGLEGSDSITATDGGNVLFGGIGNDTLIGGAGADSLWGAPTGAVAGKGLEANRLEGRGGNDQIFSEALGDQVFGGDGDDQVTISALGDTFRAEGGSGTDTLISLASMALTVPILFIGGPVVTFRSASAQTGSSLGAFLEFEHFTIFGSGRGDTIFGGDFNDRLFANGFLNPASAGAASIDGGAGDDVVGLSGRNPGSVATLNGGAGVDTLEWAFPAAGIFADQPGAIVVDFPAGTLSYDGAIFARAINVEKLSLGISWDKVIGPVVITGGADSDKLELFSRAATYTANAGAGNDYVRAWSNVQGSLGGGDGDDVIELQGNVASSVNTLSGGGGDDILRLEGGFGAPLAIAGYNVSSFEQLRLYGNFSSTTGYFNAFQKVYAPVVEVPIPSRVNLIDAGTVNLAGKNGFVKNFYGVPVLASPLLFTAHADGNTVIGDLAPLSLTASGSAGSTLLGGEANDTFAGALGADVAIGGKGDDSLTAGGAASGYDILFGGEGNDVIAKGAAGAFYVLGEAGDDRIQAGAGAADLSLYDYVFAGAGADQVSKSGTGRLYVEGGAGNDVITGGDQTLPGSEAVEYLFGDGGADTINGGAGNDVLVGANYGASDPDPGLDPVDSLSGGDGNDYVLQGSWGRATMVGDAGADTIVGAAKSDTLSGGAGDDFLFGGGGGDFFDFALADLAAGGSDTVYDFYSAGQTIRFTGVAASAVTFSAVGADFVALSVAVSGGTHTILAGTFGLTSLAQVQAQTVFL